MAATGRERQTVIVLGRPLARAMTRRGPRNDGVGMRNIIRILAVLAATLVAPSSAQSPQSVDLALVLAVDASGSVDQVRFELQKQGYVAAFRHPRVIGAIQSGPAGAIAVIMMQWTGPALQVTAVPWTKISDAASANAFADAIARAPRALFSGGTSISGAIDTSMALLFDNPVSRGAARDRHLRRRREQSRAPGQSGA